ncbi:hypothetical protein OGATHE_005218 [Ogataea polymorpha]|uniref:Uncharacterized protein n=1 Tax=Ogataea polymorpha TaxID=460523 RepID=A0A9P8SZY1_9ASCO|nr:hypothetical protein OGATHE_005218 [Ogataea polymorpha]
MAEPGVILCSDFNAKSGLTAPIPPAIMMGLWNPRISSLLSPLTIFVVRVLKYPLMHGLPNSLLKAADPNGASIIMSKDDAMCPGFPTSSSQGWRRVGIIRSETENPDSPHFVLDPLPTAASSLISPPEPVAAPGKGDTAVGWL